MKGNWGGGATPTRDISISLPDNQLVDASQRLGEVATQLRSLIPLLSTDQIEGLLDDQFELFEGRTVSARVARSITAWAEAGQKERSIPGRSRHLPKRRKVVVGTTEDCQSGEQTLDESDEK